MLAVFIFHSTRFFDTEGWHLKNADQSEFVFILMRGLVWPWLMEIFFLVSGVGSWYALKSRTAGVYLWDRVKRLLVPLYTVGLFILIPPQFYFEIRTNSGFSGTFWQSIPLYFARITFPGLTSNPGSLLPFPWTGHLWFLQYLFLISLISLPLLFYLKSERGRSWITSLAERCNRRGAIFIFAIPLFLTLVCLWGFFAGRGWADFLWYLIYFVIGYLFAAEERFSTSIKKHGWTGLVLWVVGSGMSGLFVLVLGFNPFPGEEPFSLLFVLYQIAVGLTSWSAVVFILNVGARYLNSNHKLLAYSNEAVLPFYLFHQTILLCVGWFVLPWETGILLKLFAVSVVSFALIMLLYELLVRRFDIVRFLFGMRPKKRPVTDKNTIRSM
jgi:glucan biosynthesis protein C